MQNENRFVRLSRKDVTAGVEKKGNLDYLSWAYAWNLLCETTQKPLTTSVSRHGSLISQ